MTKLVDQKSAVNNRRIENRESRIENRELGVSNPQSQTQLSTLNSQLSTNCHISLLTGGGDRPYALGLAAALTSAGLAVDFIGSDDPALPELRNNHLVNFLNLRGDQNPGANLARKVARILTYYWRLIRYAATAKPKVFHILWNNKFELFDRTLLMLYYKLLGKRLVLTAHNVNIRKRDCTDTWLNRFSLRAQHQLVEHIMLHT